MISHVRYATQGEPRYVNTHPFVRELRGREWVFAHNGDVSAITRRSEFKLRYYFPVGGTDSEYAFCCIMDALRGLGEGINSVIKISEVIWGLANRIGSHGKFNFLLSNGVYLFAYMNRRRTLYYLLRHPPHKGYARLCDEDFEVSLGEIKAPDEYAALIATRPLTDEDWRPFELNTLYVFCNGDVILKVDAEGRLMHALSSTEVEVLSYIRKSPHSVKLKEVSAGIGLSIDETYEIVRGLVARGFLRQHSKDRVSANHPEARFFTEPSRWEIIDTLIVK